MREQAERFTAPSEEEEDIEVDESFRNKAFLPGSFLHLRRNKVEGHGVLLARGTELGREIALTLTSSGDMWEHYVEDIMYSIPRFVPTSLAARCGTLPTPATKGEHSARVTVLKQVREMERKLEGALASIGRQIGDLYPMVKSSDPDEWAQVTLDQAIQLIPPARKLDDALHGLVLQKSILDRYKEFTIASTYESPPTRFLARPQSHVDTIDAVTNMVRLIGEPHGPIQSFAAKARKIISAARERDLESWYETPSSQPVDKPVFDSDDITILTFLRRALRRIRHIQHDPYSVGTSTIVKAVGMYETPVLEHTVRQLLVEVGVLAPWQGAETEVRGLTSDYPLDVKALPRVEEKHLIRSSCAGATSIVDSAPVGPDDLYAKDPLESVRHDFGDMPVYVIDDVDAQELDDGLSIEPIASEPGSAWVHVHIADPTSVIPPTHWIAARARQMILTMYYVHETDPMLPPLPQLKDLSLGARSARGKPETVLTFSFKVDPSGQFADYKVRAGLVRNVRRVSYGQVDRALKHEPTMPRYPFGNARAPRAVDEVPLGEADVRNLAALKEVADYLWNYQYNRGVFNYDIPSASISASPLPLPPSPSDMAFPHEYRGFPSLTYSIEDFSIYSQGSRKIVAECMKAACRVASRFGKDHDIPLIRRSQARPSAPSEEVLQQVVDSRNSAMVADRYLALALGVSPAPGKYTLQPEEHWTLGAPRGEGYARVTSPLRRFSDLVAHWQIKHALLPSCPAFTLPLMEELLKEQDLKGKERMKTMQMHMIQWATKFLYRWRHDPQFAGKRREHDPLENLTARLVQEARFAIVDGYGIAKVMVPELAMEGRVVRLRKSVEKYKPGDALRVRLVELDNPYLSNLNFEEK
ncbi:RNB-domain-containing protein [Gloeophyllum trabeum ATCC 11539]|uniref:RNB-domain-containing protein n=1 Tax=Gloeophyllum trabeum (strain ATCC 11539 / FP-39264 / Madison 617) TaxID=670483 RepID=S7RNL5_GLOTA|nr:RNB-domain-containing protein [Gloeophyllum trabeum ATCC 11539]EPQ54359.1 RNB-domain-containing protein [Gloeophyllum trabeum ATCC 11539]